MVVRTAAGSAMTTVTLGQFAPSFSVLNRRYVAGIILRSDGSGAQGGGAYDILGPTGNSFGYPTVAAQEGDVVELFGVGLGPTTPTVPAGKAFSGAAPVANGISLYINNVRVVPTFVGLSSAGLDQINLIVPPGLGEGEVPILWQLQAECKLSPECYFLSEPACRLRLPAAAAADRAAAVVELRWRIRRRQRWWVGRRQRRRVGRRQRWRIGRWQRRRIGRWQRRRIGRWWRREFRRGSTPPGALPAPAAI